jgi:hypothetical protein
LSRDKYFSWLLWIALGIMAVYAAFWALYAAGDVMMGEWSGVVYFIPVLLVLGLMALCWKLPLVGGLVSLLAGMLLMLRVYTTVQGSGEEISAVLVIGGPFVLAGALVLLFTALSRHEPGAPARLDSPST